MAVCGYGLLGSKREGRGARQARGGQAVRRPFRPRHPPLPLPQPPPSARRLCGLTAHRHTHQPGPCPTLRPFRPLPPRSCLLTRHGAIGCILMFFLGEVTSPVFNVFNISK
jgi:hypothetical protein